ncbi:MAG: glycosyltransferase family 2 protein, partial [Neisseriaceae bacterium]|nr:glycosyltransferase family 2 protein [Neisseriaceae bacterium]
NQSIGFENLEVIFVDDCSTDNTIELIHSTLNSDIHYQVHKLPVNSGGASIPRNLGMKHAKGEYLFFMDSDDNIYSYTIADAIKYIEKTNCDCLYLKFDSPSGRGIPIRVFQAGNVETADLLKHHLTRSLNPMKFYRNSMLQVHRIGFPLLRSNEDRLFNTEVLCHTNRCSILGDKPYISVYDCDEVSLTVYSYFTMVDYIKVTQSIFSIIDNAGLDFVKKLQIFNGMMRLVFDLVIRFYKKERDVSHWIRIILCHAHMMGVFILEEEVYPEHKEMFKIFQQYDTYGVTRTYQ